MARTKQTRDRTPKEAVETDDKKPLTPEEWPAIKIKDIKLTGKKVRSVDLTMGTSEFYDAAACFNSKLRLSIRKIENPCRKLSLK